MPILTCPTCGSKLEVADEDVGHTVQCGSCQQTFTAADPTAKKNDGASRKPNAFQDKDADQDDEGDRPSRRSSRDRDDDDDDRDSGYRRSRSRYRDDDRDYEQRYGSPPQTGMGIASMILGIMSIPTTFCYGLGIPCAILAIVFGILSLKTEGRGMGIAGIITAAVAFLLLLGLILYVVAVMSTVGAGGPGGGGPAGGGGGGRF